MKAQYKLLILLILFGCHESTRNQTKNDNSAIKENGLPKVDRSTSNNLTNDENPAHIVLPEGTIQVETNFLPDNLNAMNNPVRILQTGTFHKDEVFPNSSKLKWTGLFKSDNKFYIKDTRVEFSRKHDKEMDEENQNTGWLVKCTDPDSTKLLLSGIDDLSHGDIKPIELSKDALLPGDKEEFNYSGTTYTLYASGKKKDGYIYNYKLFLMANIKGHNFNQLLVAQPFFGEAFTTQVLTTIYFAGDLDGDNIPDFLIDTTDALAASTPCLYLSKPAGDKAILKLVASCGSSD